MDKDDGAVRQSVWRVSPEENAEIDALAALSGMSKQDYCMYVNYWSILYCMLGLPPVA